MNPAEIISALQIGYLNFNYWIRNSINIFFDFRFLKVDISKFKCKILSIQLITWVIKEKKLIKEFKTKLLIQFLLKLLNYFVSKYTSFRTLKYQILKAVIFSIGLFKKEK